MPSTTFFNLPSEKREKLLAAARAEFARVPLCGGLHQQDDTGGGHPQRQLLHVLP